MAKQREVFETTVGSVAEELARRGIGPNQRVILTIEPDQDDVPGRRESRVRVIAAGLSDEDLDRLIDEARTEVQSLIK